jgi:hypothetical protein
MKFKLSLAQLSKLSKRERALFYGVVITVSVAATERLVITPITSRLSELDEEILLKETQVRKHWRELAVRDSVRRAYAQYAGYSAAAGSDEEEMARLLAEIEGLASRVGVSLVDVRSRPSSLTDVGKQYPVEIDAETEMAGLVRFLHGLHSSKYLLRVKQMRVAPKESRGTQVKVNLLIQETVLQ